MNNPKPPKADFGQERENIMEYPQEVLDTIKEKIIGEAQGMRAANKIVPVDGERMDLDVGDRSIPVVYYPAEQKNRPLIITFHGGGFLFGGNALDNKLWGYLRENLKVNVASVEYRKSPEYQYKEALDDAYDAAVYLIEHADQFGFDAKDVSVYGASAGASLAATLCIYAKKKGKNLFRRQMLMYPFLDSYTDPAEKGRGSLEGPIMYIFNDMHSSHEEAKQSIVSPVYATREELAGLPAAIFCMAENDNLRHEGFTYAKLLAEADVDVSMIQIANMPHGFVENYFSLSEDNDLSFMGEEVIRQLQNGEIEEGTKKCMEFVKEHFR